MIGARDDLRPVLLCVTALALAACDWWWLAGPRWTGLVERRAWIARHRSELEAARRELAAGAGTRREVRAAARALRRAAARLPDQRELAALLAALAENARDARLELIGLRPLPERPQPDHVEVPVELRLRGTFAEALRFLRRVERIGRLVHVGDLVLERPERAGARVVLQARCTAVTYRLEPARARRPGRGRIG